MPIRRLLISALIGVYFLSLLWLVIGIPVTFNSPDEAANYVFAKEFSQNGDMTLIEEDNLALDGLLHPRAVLSIGDRLVPRSFLGLPVVAGILGIVFGDYGILLLTPVLAVLCVLAWRDIAFRLFQDARVANVSAFLLAIHPAFWYYSGRTMMHNVGFIAFLVFAFWFASKKRVDFFLSGASLAIALAFRTSEAVWVLPGVGLICWYAREVLSAKKIGLLVLGFILVMLPFAAFNQHLYGSFFKTGYQVNHVAEPEVIETSTIPEENSTTVLDTAMRILFPFGVAERATMRHVWQYAVALYPWMSIAMIVGALMVLMRYKKIEYGERWLTLLSIWITLSIWLLVVYGSWTFHDNPNPHLFTLGNSYVRYWIPLFLLGTPFAAFAISKMNHRGLRIFVLAVFMILSVNLVFFGEDGFVQTRENLKVFDQKRERILALTEQDAIVIVDRADKFVYPDRRVVTPLRSDATYQAIPEMLEMAPLYYFGITLPAEDLDYLNRIQLNGVSIAPVETVFDETLYRISRNP